MSPANDDRAPPATTEQFAAQEFQPFEAAFSSETWERFIPEAYTLLALAKAAVAKSKPELVQIVREALDEDNAETLGRFVEAVGDAAETFEKYAQILRATEARHFIAEAVIELEGQHHG